MEEISELLDGLNERQREAVAAPFGNYLVLAGAGSGKTRVLTQRIAWLLNVEHVHERAIMAVTFTNKAAAEMRKRLLHTLKRDDQQGLYGMWVGTFHSIAHRLLRVHYAEAGLPRDFQIMDSEDQQRLIKRLLKAHNYDDKSYPPRQVSWFINHHKDRARRPQDISVAQTLGKEWIKIYQLYQEACDRSGAVDFAEMLLRCYEFLQKYPLILQHYQQRFSQILVDEFQDSNHIQYLWIRLLAGAGSHVMIVGDDDQSIYGWRGAKVENISLFLKDFQAKTIRMEQNYRSTGNILKSANQLIANNDDRLGKNLWTQDGEGEPVDVYQAFNEKDEALFVVSQIKQWQEQGHSLNHCAVLYRSNALSRVIEEALLRNKIPYRIYGGMRFFERQEIKDALAYLRLIALRDDDISFERIINTPPRGIGNRTMEEIRQISHEQQITLWQALNWGLHNQIFSVRAATVLLRFTELINQLDNETKDMPLAAQTKHVIQYSGLEQMYREEKSEKGDTRIENLEELVNATTDFIKPDEDQDVSDLVSFLSHASLEAGEGQAEEHEDYIEMMTLHSAKGLEFPRVLIIGMEEGIFPSRKSVEEGNLSEERRLAYVGITRAMKKLTLSYAQSRSMFGRTEIHASSRFLKELPESCLKEIRMKGVVTPLANRYKVGSVAPNLNESKWKTGQKVRHPKFGQGTIIHVEGSESNVRLQIAFYQQGVKWLIAAMAKLERIE